MRTHPLHNENIMRGQILQTGVQAYCYKSLVKPVLEYTAVVCDPHQQHLKSSLEMVQRRSAQHILHYFSPTSSA